MGVAPSVSTSPWWPALRWVVFAGLTFAAGEAGRATYHEPSGISLIAPVYGVSALWLATSTRRSLPWDLAGIAFASGLAVVLTGGDVFMVSVAVLLGVASPFVWRLLFVQLAPGVWGTGGDRPIGRLTDLVGFLAACIAAGTLAAALRGTGMFLLPPLDVETLLLTVIRNVSWILAITALGLLALPQPDLGIRAWWAEVESRPVCGWSRPRWCCCWSPPSRSPRSRPTRRRSPSRWCSARSGRRSGCRRPPRC